MGCGEANSKNTPVLICLFEAYREEQREFFDKIKESYRHKKTIKYEITIRNIKLINQFKKAISKYFTFLEHLKYKIIDIFTLNRNDVFFINNDIENFKLILVILNTKILFIND